MTYQKTFKDILSLIKNAISSALNEEEFNVSVEIKELTKKENIYEITGTFKVSLLFARRIGKFNVTINISEECLEIINLKIDEKQEG